MLMMTWTHEIPCPLCETPVVWTMTDREYCDVREELRLDPEKAGWIANCRCAGCDGALLVMLRAQDGGLCMTSTIGTQEA